MNLGLHRKKMSAWMRAHLAATPLQGAMPPGSLATSYSNYDGKRHFFQERAQTDGPIFKLWFYNKLTICVVGQDLSMKLTREYADNLFTPVVDYAKMFPGGLLRRMEGEQHRAFRPAVSATVSGVPVGESEARLRALFQRVAESLLALPQPAEMNDAAIVMRKAALELTMMMIIGVQPGSELEQRLRPMFVDFSREMKLARITPELRRMYEEIAAIVRPHAEAIKQDDTVEPSMLLQALNGDTYDEQMLGNLIFSVESVAEDMQRLWSWMLEEFADQPTLMDAICTSGDLQERRRIVRAAISETMRMHQSEYIMRKVTKGFTFEGFAFPRGALVRLCLWEGHNDDTKFACPHQFDATRFEQAKYDGSHFSPFGVDHHKCVAAGWALAVCGLLAEELTNRLTMTRIHRAEPLARANQSFPGGESVIEFGPRAKPSRH